MDQLTAPLKLLKSVSFLELGSTRLILLTARDESRVSGQLVVFSCKTTVGLKFSLSLAFHGPLLAFVKLGLFSTCCGATTVGDLRKPSGAGNSFCSKCRKRYSHDYPLATVAYRSPRFPGRVIARRREGEVDAVLLTWLEQRSRLAPLEQVLAAQELRDELLAFAQAFTELVVEEGIRPPKSAHQARILGKRAFAQVGS